MGRRAAVVRWERWHLRPFLSRRGAMACCRRKSPAPQSHGTGDDLFHTAQFLLLWRRLRRLLAGLDLVQHRAGHSQAQESARTKNTRRTDSRMEARTRAHAEVSAN